MRFERGAVRLALQLEVVPRFGGGDLGARELRFGGSQLDDGGLLRGRAVVRVVGRRGGSGCVVDLRVDPDAAHQQEGGEDDREKLLALGRLDFLDVDACAHFASLLVRARSWTISSQSSASAIRSS